MVLPDHYEAFRAKLESEKAAALKEKQEKEKVEAAAAAAAEAEAKAKAEAEAAAVKAEGDGAEDAPPGAEEPAVKKEGGEGEAEVKAEAEANGDQPMADVKQEGGEQAKEGAEVKADGEGEGQVKKEEEEQQQAVTVGDDEIKVLWVRQQDELYDRTKAELLKRKPFEDAVRRPYFHVKPLDGVQLWNWIRYLDATEAGGDHAAIVTLFERCLVACANYPGGARKPGSARVFAAAAAATGRLAPALVCIWACLQRDIGHMGCARSAPPAACTVRVPRAFLDTALSRPPAGLRTLVAAERAAATNRLGRGY